MHTLIFRQTLPISLDEAWEFFSDPARLGTITPPIMNFRITYQDSMEKLYPGMIIIYRVSPLLGIPMQWVTEITQVAERKYFIDSQLKGPYRLWHHQHWFRETPGGVEMTDILHYELPGGFLGKWLNFLLIGKKVKEIFTYRSTRLKELLG